MFYGKDERHSRSVNFGILTILTDGSWLFGATCYATYEKERVEPRDYFKCQKWSQKFGHTLLDGVNIVNSLPKQTHRLAFLVCMA